MVEHVPEDLLDVVAPSLGETEKALKVRDAYENFVRGGKARASYLPREMISSLGFAVVDLMLLRIVNGTVKPKSAKEAAEVARIAHDLARKELGENDVSIVIRSPEERQKALDRLAEMHTLARQRAVEAENSRPDDAAIDDAEIVEDPDLEYGGIPQTAAYGDALVIVPR